MKILIGIPTFQRPQMLADALDSLSGQFSDSPLDVLVVDNDPALSGRAVAHSARKNLNLVYMAEASRGVCAVRNRIIDYAEESGYSAILFIDDDEIAEPEWFQSMKEAHAKSPLVVFSGPVRYDLGGDCPPSPLQLMVLSRRPPERGRRMTTTGCGNTLLPLAALAVLSIPRFDESFARSGGEDTDFFTRLSSRGVLISWNPGAVVCETVPADRATSRALLARVERNGQINGTIARRNHSAMLVFCGGLARAALGALELGFRRDRARRTSGRVRFRAGIGYMRAAIGQVAVAYGEGSSE